MPARKKVNTKSERDAYKIPRSVQDVIPIKRVWEDGIFQVGSNYVKSFKFTDINYFTSSDEEKESIFRKYSTLLNSFDGAQVKITIYNRRLNRKAFEESILMPMVDDELDYYRFEYNQVLLEKAVGDSGIIQEKYVTVSVYKQTVEEARNYFNRIEADLRLKFSALGSKLTELNAVEKLRILHDFYRVGEEMKYKLDLRELMRHGHDFKDYICPDSIEVHTDYLKLGKQYARVLFMKDYATFIADKFVSDLVAFNPNMMLSIDFMPVAMDKAMRDIETRMLGIETNIANWQRRQNANNNFSATIPYDMELQRAETKEFLADLTTRDQRMMLALLTMVITADSKEQLDAMTESILSQQGMCQIAPMTFQQIDALNTVLPIGIKRIKATRTLTTESLAVLLPFKTQEIQETGGIYFGENAVSKNLILCNLSNLLNQSMIVLGVPGSGKSFFVKLLIIFLALATDDDIMICDPEGEYAAIANALGGEVIHIAAGGKDKINAMDIVEGYGENNPVAQKAQFVMSLIEQIDKNGVGAKQKSIIDRCVAGIYKEQMETGNVATLCSLREMLLRQPEPEAKGLALSLELFTTGSLDVFAHKTNVNTKSRIIVYDIHDLGAQLKPAGLLTITDALINRVSANWRKGKRTHIFIDEFHTVYENEHSANFFTSAWRQFRKRNAYPCAITQNVEYLLDSVQASTMLSNSEFVVMLNQAASDRDKLAELLNISDEQLKYITDAEAGSGLIKYGPSLVPFTNRFPSDTRLYELISTKPGEMVWRE